MQLLGPKRLTFPLPFPNLSGRRGRFFRWKNVESVASWARSRPTARRSTRPQRAAWSSSARQLSKIDQPQAPGLR